MESQFLRNNNLKLIIHSFVYVLIIFYTLVSIIKSDSLNPLINLNLSEFTKSPLPPYRDAIARSIKGAAIYFSIIEGATPYGAVIKAPENFITLTNEWYSRYFLLNRKLVLQCEVSDCEYEIVEAPTIQEATNSGRLYPFKIIKN